MNTDGDIRSEHLREQGIAAFATMMIRAYGEDRAPALIKLFDQDPTHDDRFLTGLLIGSYMALYLQDRGEDVRATLAPLVETSKKFAQ